MNNCIPHIVHLIASSGLYGAEKWILALMRSMDTSRFSSTLVNLADTPDEQSAIVAAALEKNLTAIDFYTGGTFNPLSITRFSRWLKENNVDIVHGHGYKSDIIGLIAARLSGCKIITTPHGWSKEQDKKLQFYENIDRFILRFLDHICPLSEELMENVKKCVNSNKISLISNGVDIDEIDSYKPAFEKKNNEFVIGYIGRLVDGKNLPVLIHAVKRLIMVSLTNNDFRIRVLIIGDGDAAVPLQQLVFDLELHQYVEFLGFCSDAIAYLKCFDIFVLPSKSEGIPRCLMESMAAMVPVAASDIRGNRVLVQDKITGFLFPVFGIEPLFLILKEATQNIQKFLNTTGPAREKIEQIFSNKRMAKEYSNLYHFLLNAQK